MGSSYHELKQYENAIRSFEFGLKIEPNSKTMKEGRDRGIEEWAKTQPDEPLEEFTESPKVE